MDKISNQLIPINFSDIPFIKIGHEENSEAKTGVTVLYFPEKAIVGISIFGGGPASRESPLATPLTADTFVNAICFSGGSVFGLEASDGVVQFLEEKNIGIHSPFSTIPIVLQSCIFDLSYGSSKIRPNKKMGYQAAKNAFEGKTEIKSGDYGAGKGATIGKLLGMKRASKGGIGFSSFKFGDFLICAVVVVNSMGDIFKNDKKICGLLSEDRKNFSDFLEELIKFGPHSNIFGYEKHKENTTIGAIIINGNFNKAELNIIANFSRAAYDKCIRPCATMMDGDTIYAVSTGKEKINLDINIAGIISEYAMEQAIINAAENSKIDDEEYLKNIKDI